MALPLSNTAEGGTNGATVTTGNSGGTSGDAWNAQSGTTLVYDNTTASNGTVSYKFTTAATVAACYEGWTTSLGTLATNQTLFIRWYYRAPATPTSSVRLIQLLHASPSSVLLAVTHASGTGDIAVQAGTTTQAPQTGTALTANTWYRIEAQFTGIGGGTTAGGYTVTVYQGNTATVVGSQITGSGKNFGTTAPDTLRFGITTANASVSSSYWFDDLAVSATGMPAVPGAGADVMPDVTMAPRIPSY